MLKEVFLIVLGIAWIVFAVVQDTRKREVANWLNFSLIIFALGFRFFYSLFSEINFSFFYQGLIGLGIFFALGNLFYYGRIFAGGDAKLMIALGAVIPFYNNFYENASVFVIFLLIFLISGALYGIFASAYLTLNGRKKFAKEFKRRFGTNRNKIYFAMFAGIIFCIAGFFIREFFFLGVIIFLSPYFYIWAKSVDESCMVKKVSYKDLTEGDWLYRDVKIGRKIVKAKWDGLDKKEIALLARSRKNVFIRTGIPFTPVFLIAFLIMVYILFF